MKLKQTMLLAFSFAGIILLSCQSNADSSAAISPDSTKIIKIFKAEKEKLSVTEAAKLLSDGALLIDVRDADELAEQSYAVKNVINIPLGELEKQLSRIPKDKLVILACQSGHRSGEAFDTLKQRGFINIANMEGGMNAWVEAGLPNKPGLTANTQAGRLEVYCFHGTRQCETCKNMKANTKATLDKYFSEQLKNGSIAFFIIDVDDAKNEKLAEKFQASGTALMINHVVNGKENITDWSDFAFEKADNANKFISELKAKIDDVLKK